MIITIAAILLRIPPDLPAVLLFSQTAPPDNLVAFQWVAITALSGAIVALAAYIRSLLAEIRQMAKDHKAEILLLAEKSLANSYEMKEAIKDCTEAIGTIGEKLERSNRARTNRNGKGNG